MQNVKLYLYTNLNSKWIINLNARAKTEFLEENIGVNFYDFGLHNRFFNMLPNQKW